MIECCSLSIGDDMRPGGVADKSEGCADIQRDFDRLEQQAERNHIKLNNGKYKSWPWGGTTQ